MLATQIRIVLRMRGAVRLLPYMTLWRTKRQHILENLSQKCALPDCTVSHPGRRHSSEPQLLRV